MNHPNPEEAAAAIRNELLARGWPTSTEVGLANGKSVIDSATWAKSKRNSGELLGVWSAADQTYRHPSFQFFADGVLRPRIRELLVALAESPECSEDADPSGWRRAFCLHGSSYGLLGAHGEPRAAADVFPEDPESVIQWARRRAEEDPNSYW